MIRSLTLVALAAAAFLAAAPAHAASVGCIGRLYDRRIAALQQIIDTRVVVRGPF
ncbi:hypothetical protein [Sphingomonas sp.]|uniref:hypothetical protein n=1 Tax=Sphingomonas sp. TaxID=28214 RepID=UPI001B235FE3|nr:hypothetical protein [Sphingomonas sp.]MBO9715010.1 hypothetical protein [Sphingomonas sp.]